MADSTGEVDVPAGYVHRGVLVARGWSAELLRPLREHAITVEGVPVGVSNKAYPVGVVAEYEAGDPEVRRAVDNRASFIARTGATYTRENLLTREQILRRGWTSAHIARLLGDPDVANERFGVPVAGRWGLDRIETAERTDARLRARLAHVKKQRAEAIATLTDVRGLRIFRRRGPMWVVQGFDLTEGEQVTVTKKGGASTDVVIERILETDGEGKSVATFRNVDAPRPAPARRAHPVKPTVVEQAAEATVLVYEMPVLEVPMRTVTGEVIVPLKTRRRRLTEAEEFMDYEYGYQVTYRPATDAETALLAAGTVEEGPHLPTSRAVRRAENDILAIFRRHGRRPKTAAPAGRVLADSRGRVGGGRAYVVDDDGASVWLIEAGYDGVRNMPGATATALDLADFPRAVARIEALDATMKAST